MAVAMMSWRWNKVQLREFLDEWQIVVKNLFWKELIFIQLSVLIKQINAIFVCNLCASQYLHNWSRGLCTIL